MADTLLECYWLLPDRSFQLAATPREPGPNVTRPPTNAPAVWRWRKATAAANRPRLSPRNAKKVNIIIRIHYGFMLVYHSWLPGYPSRSRPPLFLLLFTCNVMKKEGEGRRKNGETDILLRRLWMMPRLNPASLCACSTNRLGSSRKEGKKKRIDGWKDGRDREWRTRRRKKKPVRRYYIETWKRI